MDTTKVEMPTPGALTADPLIVPGFRVVAHGWEKVDGRTLLKLDDGRYGAMYMFEFKPEPENVPTKRAATPLQPESASQSNPF